VGSPAGLRPAANDMAFVAFTGEIGAGSRL
jgi:hypothetical protein